MAVDETADVYVKKPKSPKVRGVVECAKMQFFEKYSSIRIL